MRPNLYRILEMALENGIGYGVRRAFKHVEHPEPEAIEEAVHNAVLNELHEWFDFDNDVPRLSHTAQISWNPDGTVDRVAVTHEGRCIFVIEDMGGEWDCHIGPVGTQLHLSLGRRGIVLEAPGDLRRSK